jgi:ribosomal biogenesis protein LAS1
LAGNVSEGLSNRWSIAKSWTPCPIGTVPCSFSSTTVLPAFDVTYDGLENAMVEQHENLEDHDLKKFESQPEELEVETMLEVSTPPRDP